MVTWILIFSCTHPHTLLSFYVGKSHTLFVNKYEVQKEIHYCTGLNRVPQISCPLGRSEMRLPWIRTGHKSKQSLEEEERPQRDKQRRPFKDLGRQGWSPKAGRGTQSFSPRAFKDSMAMQQPSFGNSGLQNFERTNLCFLNPPTMY